MERIWLIVIANQWSFSPVNSGWAQPGSGFANGFRQLGWIVHEIDLRYFIGQAKTTIRDKIVGRLQRQPALEAYRTRILSDCRALKPDLFLTTKGIGITPDLLSKIKALDVVTANFYTDYHFNYPDVDQAAFPLYDRFITCKSFQIEWLEQRREPGTTHFIPNGYSQQTHLPVYRSIGPDDYLNDVGYAGNRSSYKQALLKDLLALNPDLDLKITGSNWQEFADTSARPDIYDGVPRGGSDLLRVHSAIPDQPFVSFRANQQRMAGPYFAPHVGDTGVQWVHATCRQ